MYADGRIKQACIPLTADESSWERPDLKAGLADDRSLIETIREAGADVDAILGRLDALPQAYAHGDASPQNLLRPLGEPGTFAVIDWGFNTPQAVGFDLSQLLVGLVHCDEMAAERLPELEPLVVAAYTEGLQAVGFEATYDDVHAGYALSLVVRDLFTVFGLDMPPDPELWTPEHTTNRVGLATYIAGLYQEHRP